jgi:TonB family protein
MIAFMPLLLLLGDVPPLPVNPIPGLSIVDTAPGEVTCGGVRQKPVFVARPVPVTQHVPQKFPAETTIDFRIDAGGRPLGIGAPKFDERVYFANDDLAPALAAWRFAPGAERTSCTVRFALAVHPVKTAPMALVHRAYALPHSGRAGDTALRERLKEEAQSCMAPRAPAVRVRAFPEFEKIPQPQGTSSYAMVGFDISADGKPRGMRILSSDGNAELDRAAMRAVGKSRFARGARKGCTYPYHRRQPEPVAAPMLPPTGSFRPADAQCPPEAAKWSPPGRPTFPEPFHRRAIEGVALIGYDVAPWGMAGNVKVLASEPAAAFGEQARQIVAASTRPASKTGATGCVARIVFRMP